ncbi:hypothetical protein B6I21_06275 [candidate division KSB1 bacterium 4572_119]|nr:MAG: hypothetical protein B6I21_06275 [candidate division KSB1 bacterium 4572_119]
MDVKLDSLIEKIKKEGIEAGQKSADEILAEAKKKAAGIVGDAKKEADKIISDGKKQAGQFRTNAEADIQQAARNAELLLKERINSIFDNVFKKEVADSLKPDFLTGLIQGIVDSWAKDSKADVVVNEKDKKQLESLLFKGLKKQLKDSITIRVSNDISSGFKIGLKDEQVYYDFSDDAISEFIKSLINPKLKEILDKK